MDWIIEDEHTCKLAVDLAAITGESVEEAVDVALRERLNRLGVSAEDENTDDDSKEKA